MTEPHPQPEVAGGVAWEIVGWSPQHPFGGALILEDTQGRVRVPLEPLLVRELAELLSGVHQAQRHALGLPRSEEHPEPSAAAGAHSGGSSGDRRPWWRRHKGLAVILAVIGAVLAYEVIAGAVRIS